MEDQRKPDDTALEPDGLDKIAEEPQAGPPILFRVPMPGGVTSVGMSVEEMRKRKQSPVQNLLSAVNGTELNPNPKLTKEMKLFALAGVFGADQFPATCTDWKVLRASPNIVMDWYTGCALSIKDKGELSPENIRHMEDVKSIYPDKFNAAMRDLTRIVRNKAKGKNVQHLPTVNNSTFEDPFGVGLHNLEILAKDQIDLRPQMAKLMPFFTADQKTRIEAFKGKLPQKLSPAMQSMLLMNILDDLYKIKNLDPKGKNLDQDQAIDVWNYYRNILKDTNIHGKLLLFMGLRPQIAEDKGVACIEQLITEFFSPPKGSKNSVHGLIQFCNGSAGKYLPRLLETSGKIYNEFIGLAKNGSVYENAFALKILGDYCTDGIGDRQQKVQKVVKDIFGTKESKEKFGETKLFVFLTELEDYEQLLPAILDALFENPEIITSLSAEIYRSAQPKMVATHFRDRFPIFNMFDPELIIGAVTRRMALKPATGKMYQAMTTLKFVADFDEPRAVNEIRAQSTLPLVEQRHMDVSDVLPSEYTVFISPNSKTEGSLASWKVRIILQSFGNKDMIHEELELEFEDCVLRTDVPGKARSIAQKIGLYIGHKYFVRQPTDEIVPETPAVVEIDQPDSEPPKGDSDLPPDNEPGREFAPREQKPLTIDICDEDQKRLKRSTSEIRKTLETNKNNVLKLLAGQNDGIDLNNVIIHRKISGLRPNENIFERVPVQELIDAIAAGKLSDQDWHILNTLPHIKALGYHVWSREVEKHLPPLWRVSRKKRSETAQLAYLYYRDAGFPELSQFAEVKASLGILADAKSKEDEFVIISEAGTNGKIGKELFSGRSTETDLNARLAEKMTDAEWMEGWLETQRRIINDEINGVIESNLPDEVKLQEMEERENALKDLPKLVTQILKQSYCKTFEMAEHTTKTQVRLALGWVPTETSFNQGNFLTIQELFLQASGEHPVPPKQSEIKKTA